MQNTILLGTFPNLFMQNILFLIFSRSEERDYYYFFFYEKNEKRE